MDRFALRMVDQSRTHGGWVIVTFTDVPSHLWLRWTTNQPWIHDKPVLRRGLKMHSDRYFCFNAYTDLEQEEANDTTIHTFVILSWPDCQTRHFYFLGTINGITVPSTSPIFHKHYKEADAPPYPTYELTFNATLENRSVYATSVNWDTCHDKANGIILTNYDDPYYLIFAGERLTASYWAYRGFLFFDTTPLPNFATLVSAKLSIFVKKAQKLSSAGYPHLCITGAANYPPVEPSDYGDQLPYTAIRGLRDFGQLVEDQWNDIPFLPSGLPLINLWNPTLLCLRGEQDIIDNPPPLGANWVHFYSAQIGTVLSPKLTVEYHAITKPPKVTAWWEPWGTHLTQYNPWRKFHHPDLPTISFAEGVITIDNPGYLDTGIGYNPIQDSLPLLDTYQRDLHCLYFCPAATANNPRSYSPFEIWLYNKTDWFLIQLAIAKGSYWSDYGTERNPIIPYGWIYTGLGPVNINIVKLFQKFRRELGLSIDPSGWGINIINFGLGTDTLGVSDYIKNDYIGFDYPGNVPY